MYNNIYTRVQHMRRPALASGGLCLTAFAKWEDVVTWPVPDPATGMLNTAIQLKEGSTWFRLNAPDSGRQFTETPKEDDKGKYRDIAVNGVFSGDNVNLHSSVEAMIYHQFVLLVKDRSGLYKLVGNQDSGADFSYDYNSGDGGSQRRRNIVFTWQSTNSCPIYLGPEVITIDDAEYTLPVAAGGDFSDDFSDDFSNNP